MTIAYVSRGSSSTGSTSVTPGAPASIATGDGVFIVAVTKPNTATINTPAGWTLVASAAGGAGTVGGSVGPTQVAVLFREKDPSWSAMPTISITSGNSSAAQAYRFTKDAAKSWALDSRTGVYNGVTAGTALNVTTTAVDLAVGDWLFTALSNQDDAPRWSGQSYTSTGITYSAVTEIIDSELSTITGNDVGGAVWVSDVTAGSGSQTVQQQGTATANSTGGIVLVRIREVVATATIGGDLVVPSPTVAGSLLIDLELGGDIVVPTPVVAGTLATDLDIGGDLVVPTPVVAGELQVTGGPLSIGGDIVVPTPVVAGELEGAGAAGVDVTNRVNGISLRGLGTLVWEPPVQPPPEDLVMGETIVAAQSHTATVDPATGEVSMSATVATKPAARTRIIIGGIDVTYWRGKATPEPDYILAKPLGYGPATIALPQAKVPLETPGVGQLAFLAKDKPVRIQRVDPETNETIATDWIGFVVAYNLDGGSLSIECGGHAQGRAALTERQPPIFPGPNFDVGRHMYAVLTKGIGVPMKPFHGPDTGMVSRAIPGMGMLEAVSTLCAMAQSADGTQWTVLPDEGTTVYRMEPVDLETIHGTVWLDADRTTGSLRSDKSEEPNRIYARGVTPDGMRVRFGAYPNLKQGEPAPYPFNDNSPFGIGTTDADTDTGDGVTVMNNRLSAVGYRTPTEDNTGAAAGIFTADDAEAIQQLREDADLAASNNMNPAAWAALWDIGVTGFSLARARILPAAQTTETRAWIRSSSGALIARNPGYRRQVVKVDRTIDIEGRFTRRQIRRFANRVLANGQGDNWVGTITFNLHGLAEGDAEGPVNDGIVMDARDLRAGMNLKIANLDNTVVHVSGIQYQGGTVTATVDSRARDFLEAWEVIERNRESRRNPGRAWLREHRGRQVTPRTFDEIGGLLGNRVELPGNQWTIFEVAAGLAGTVGRLDIETVNDPAEFCIAIFGRRIGRKKLRQLIGNPLSPGNEAWENEHVRDRLDRDNILLYAAGDAEQPCGHWPGRDVTGEDAPNGRWRDDASFGYRTSHAGPVLWVAIYPDRDTHIKAGRIMDPQLEEGA